ncbi:MAG: hypothetical protein V3V49_02115 [Candidatus Krumholzibacteria bacterium]
MNPADRIFAASLALPLLFMGCSDPQPFSADTQRPDRIGDARLSFVDSTSGATLTWTSPQSRGNSGTVERYEIRFVYDEPFAWATAAPVVDPPLPAPPGTEQSYHIRYPDRGRNLSLAISSIDHSGNFSAPSNVAALSVPGFTFAGQCRQVFTDAPLEGIEVRLQGVEKKHSVTTDVRGEFSQPDVTPQEYQIAIHFDGNQPGYFNLDTRFVITSDIVQTFLLIPHRGSDVLPSESALSLFKSAVVRSPSRQVLKWSFPVSTYVPPFVNSLGLDYGTAARAAMQRWMDRTGITLFAFVDSPPAPIEVSVKSPGQMGANNAVTRYTVDADGFLTKAVINIVNDFSDPGFLYRVFLHESGHAIGLQHLTDRGFIMYFGQPLPGDISDDEVWIVNLFDAIPNQTFVDIYSDPEP